MSISAKDREILRDLARRQLELANSPRNRQVYADWMANGASKTQVTRPLIRIETNTFEQEIMPGMMQCEGEEARRIEHQMLRPIINFTLFGDDTLVPDYFEVADHYQFMPFNLPVKTQHTGGLGHHFIPYLTDLEEDDHLLGKSPFAVREDWAQQRVQQAQEVFGDILPVRRISNAAYCTPMQDIVHIMNMDDMYIAMIDDEERFDAMLGRLVDDYIEFFQAQEQSGTLHTAARMQHLCQGTYCFTNELTDSEPNAKLKDMWLFMDSQETAGVSPAMYRDLVFPHYKRVMDHFGLISYGCCEATHPIWDDCLSKLPHLRKVSISPWCDEEFMGERLQGTGVTFLRKPPATILGMNTPTLDEDATLACFRKTAKAARGCKIEIIQRDVYTVGSNPEKVRRFVELAREGLEG
ncbi:MAG: hypothetical protein E7327_06225 [Clostridiales bacterium]|nr:hypothetical protein [Clostridiales bacterium]